MADVTLTVAENRAPLDPPRWEDLLARVPAPLRPAILAYRRWEDRQASLLARLMLADRFGAAALASVEKDRFGRPGAPGVEFNLSHTDGIVVLAVAAERVGVDVERIKQVDLNDYATALTDRERERIASSPDPAAAFFALWTAKEAAVKADGRGMSIPLDEVAVADGVATVDGTDWRLTPVSLGEEYACHVALRRRPYAGGGTSLTLSSFSSDVFAASRRRE